MVAGTVHSFVSDIDAGTMEVEDQDVDLTYRVYAEGVGDRGFAGVAGSRFAENDFSVRVFGL